MVTLKLRSWINLIIIVLVVYIATFSYLILYTNKDNYTKFSKLQNGINCEDYSQEKTKIWTRNNDDKLQITNHLPSSCSSKIIEYNERFIVFENGEIHPNNSIGKPGGDDPNLVINQAESSEYHNMKSGFLHLQCNGTVNCSSLNNTHFKRYCEVVTLSEAERTYISKTRSKTIVAIIRYDYANLYWVLSDLYNIFFVSTYLNIPPETLSILWVDAHPVSITDELWTPLFNEVLRIGTLKEPFFIHRFISMGESLFTNKNNPPFIEDFREFILQRFNLPVERTCDCRNVRVLIILRRDYFAHPRNPSGKVRRKIDNEMELILNISKLLPGHTVESVQLDKLPIYEQLKLTSSADILVGMHGAGLAYSLVLPKHAALVEMFPIYHNMKSHMQYIANWRGLHYESWKNMKPSMEINEYTTIVDAESIAQVVNQCYFKMCKKALEV